MGVGEGVNNQEFTCVKNRVQYIIKFSKRDVEITEVGKKMLNYEKNKSKNILNDYVNTNLNVKP